MSHPQFFIGAELWHPGWSFQVVVIAIGKERFLYTRKDRKGEFVGTMSNKFYSGKK